MIALASVVFTFGALGQAVNLPCLCTVLVDVSQACHSVSTMVTGRFVVGLGVGLASCIVPLYIAELAPARARGKLVTINAVVVTLGQVIAYGMNNSDIPS